MADYNEVMFRRLYLREPGTERLRKSSAGMLKHLLTTGWRETERWYADRYITVKLQRSGVDPAIGTMPKIPPPPPRPPRRDGRGGPGGPGGGGPRR